MFGPGYGHNIEPWLQYFAYHKQIKLYYWCNNFKFTKSNNIIVIDSKLKKFIYLFFKFDLVYIHGGWNPLFTFIILCIMHHTKSVINLWGYHVINNLKGKKLIRLLYKLMLYKCSYIHCNWYSTAYEITCLYRGIQSKIITIPWGLSDSWFQKCNKDISTFTKQFINSIDKNKTNFFWPKSVIKQNRFDLVIDALPSVIKSNKSFCIYLWYGNNIDQEYLSYLKIKVSKLSLNDYVVFIKHPYLEFHEIREVWKVMDVGLNIVDHDQLSTSILEPMLLKKDLLLSKIESYNKLNSIHKTNINLTMNNNKSLTQNFIKVLNNRCSEHELEYRRKIVFKNFNFNINCKNIFNYYLLKIFP